MQIRPMRDEDFPEVTKLVEQEPQIVRHTNSTYWVLRAMDPQALLVAEGPDGIAGFLAGVYQFHLDHALLLQIAVRPGGQRAGLGAALVAGFADQALAHGAGSVRLTIHEDNVVAWAFFQAFAEERGWVLRDTGETGTLGGVLDPERIWELAPA